MSKYNFDKSLPPQPFTGMLGVLWFYQEQAAADVLRHTKAWGPDDERLAKECFRLRGLEATIRMMAAIEKYWDKEPPTRMSIKEIMGRHEQIMEQPKREFVDPQAGRDPSPKPEPKPEPRPAKAAESLFGDDDDA